MTILQPRNQLTASPEIIARVNVKWPYRPTLRHGIAIEWEHTDYLITNGVRLQMFPTWEKIDRHLLDSDEYEDDKLAMFLKWNKALQIFVPTNEISETHTFSNDEKNKWDKLIAEGRKVLINSFHQLENYKSYSAKYFGCFDFSKIKYYPSESGSGYYFYYNSNSNARVK